MLESQKEEFVCCARLQCKCRRNDDRLSNYLTLEGGLHSFVRPSTAVSSRAEQSKVEHSTAMFLLSLVVIVLLVVYKSGATYVRTKSSPG